MKTSLSVIQEFGNLCINHLLTTVIHWTWHWQWKLSQIEIMPLSWMPVSSWASSSWLQGTQSQGRSHSFLIYLNCWAWGVFTECIAYTAFHASWWMISLCWHWLLNDAGQKTFTVSEPDLNTLFFPNLICFMCMGICLYILEEDLSKPHRLKTKSARTLLASKPRQLPTLQFFEDS